MTQHRDEPAVDIPPPPYSETDIYSNSAGRSPLLGPSPTLFTLPIHQRTASHNLSVVDDASSAASTSEVIYTPPLTPRSTRSNSGPFLSPNPAASNDGFLSPGYRVDQHRAVSVTSDHLTTASAEAYFDSRPVAPGGTQSVHELRHVITVKPGSIPDDFPYRQKWAGRDVRPDDWQTFLNYLLPNHAAETNDVIIGQKLRAEGLAGSEDDRGPRHEKDASLAGDRSPVLAQLDALRADAQPGRGLNETVREWNDGFFGPRGLTIDVEQPSADHEGPRMPGSWDQSFNDASPTMNADQQSGSGSGSSSGRWWRSLPRFETSSRGLRIGGLSIDKEGVSIGDRLVADSRGLRIGALVADDSGGRLRGRDLFGGAGGSRTLGPPSVGPRPSPVFEPHNLTNDHEVHHRGPVDQYDRHEVGGRGRGRHRQGGSPRHRASSSVSSSSPSSSSSLSADSSVGSLPDHHSLQDSQIPLTCSYLEDWLAHPETPATREAVQAANATIQAAGRPSRSRSPSPSLRRHHNVNAPTTTTISAGDRCELRFLLKQWDRLKKQQKRARRESRREQKTLRRAAKRERRQTRREARLARHERMRDTRRKRLAGEARRAQAPLGQLLPRQLRQQSHQMVEQQVALQRQLLQQQQQQQQHQQHQQQEQLQQQHRQQSEQRQQQSQQLHRELQQQHQQRVQQGQQLQQQMQQQQQQRQQQQQQQFQRLHHHGFPGAGRGPAARHGGGAFPSRPSSGGGAIPFLPPPLGPRPPAEAPGAGIGGEWARRMEMWRQRSTTGREQRFFPGSWPSDDDDNNNNKNLDARGVNEHDDVGAQETGVFVGGVAEQGRRAASGGPPHAVSAALFRALEAKRRDLVQKRAALGTAHVSEWDTEKVLLLAVAEALDREVKRLAVDADEQYAKELVRMEEWQAYPEIGV